MFVYARTGRFNYNPERYDHDGDVDDQHDHFDSKMAESGRFETINSDNYMPAGYLPDHSSPHGEAEYSNDGDEEEMGQMINGGHVDEPFASRAMARCIGLRCPGAHYWSENTSF